MLEGARMSKEIKTSKNGKRVGKSIQILNV